MKTLKLTLALVLMTTLAQAQQFGVTVNRGMTTLCPDYATFKSTLNQGAGIGFYRYKTLDKNIKLKTGVSATSLRSCRSVETGEGQVQLIPEDYTYFSLPITIEKQFFAYSKMARTASHWNVQAGLNFSYLTHEENFRDRVGEEYETRPTNMGVMTAVQWVKNVTWKSSFALGPQIQAFTTGESPASVAFYASVRMDWRFGR